MTAIAIDTNLLLLLIVGDATGRVIGKRLKAYTDDDLQALRYCLDGMERLIVTPNVWTEVTNIWDYGIDGDYRRAVGEKLAELVRSSIELARPSRSVVDDPDFERLGTTDCVWLAVLDAETTLLTDDLSLYDAALSRGLKAINCTHLREFGPVIPPDGLSSGT